MDQSAIPKSQTPAVLVPDGDGSLSLSMVPNVFQITWSADNTGQMADDILDARAGGPPIPKRRASLNRYTQVGVLADLCAFLQPYRRRIIASE